jgi:tetrachlorobenzoquinone reductase
VVRHSGSALVAVRLTAIRYGAAGINLYQFSPLDDSPLPAFSAGSHIDVHLPNAVVRQYSLCNPQGERQRYVIGVKRDLNSRGGSHYMHDQLRVGTVLQVGEPRNNFALHEAAGASVFVAGGIGITPIACMVGRLRELGRRWELHYGVRQRDEAAFLQELAGDSLHLHVDAEHGGRPLPVADIVGAAPRDAHLYCCGPAPMLDAFEAAAKGRAAERVHLERFTPAQPAAVAGGYSVKLARSGRMLYVTPGQTILETLRAGGIEVQASCEQGICGTCETRVLEGLPDHRDSLLSPEERQANNVMMICCSGSKQDTLVLDL